MPACVPACILSHTHVQLSEWMMPKEYNHIKSEAAHLIYASDVNMVGRGGWELELRSEWVFGGRDECVIERW